MYIDFNDIVIELDASVRHITSAACMHLSRASWLSFSRQTIWY